MTLEEFVNQGWADHAQDPAAVFARMPEGVGLVTKAGHAPLLAGLLVHVAGEHLGRWDEGIALLERLEALPVVPASSPEAKSLARSQATLHLCAGRPDAAKAREEAGRSGGALPPASDGIRVLAVAASALVGQGRAEEGARHFEEALRLARYGPGREDPAARALAITGNNLAVALEGKATRTDAERDLMLRAARAARTYWAIAGGWLETERAEYRLAMSHLRAGDAARARTHAEACRAIVSEHGDDPGEVVFAHEALARARHAQGDLEGARREHEVASARLPAIEDPEFRAFAAGQLQALGADLNQA